jgi:hypothetical protein
MVNIVLAVLVINQVAGAFLFDRDIISYPVFKWIHKKAIWALIPVLLAHLALNWNWVKVNYFKKQN